MGLYKRKDSQFYWMTLRVNGRKFIESTGETTKKAAEDVYHKRRQELKEGRVSPVWSDPKITFDKLSEHYLEWVKNQRAFTSKRGFIAKLVKAFGDLQLRSFSTRPVEEFQTNLLSKGKKPSTVNRHIATLKHMFTKAVEWEMVGEETLRKVRRVKQLPENNRRLRYLSKEESQALINASSPHLRPIIITALNTGMRREEILSLEWGKHVDLRHGFILLDKTKNGDRREIPINTDLRETLQGLIRHINSPYVFVDSNGGRFKEVKRSFSTACRKAGLKDFHFHDLRHTFASQLVMAGVDLITVKELLGHKSIAMTLRYAHLAPGHKIKAVESLCMGNGYVLATLGKKEGATIAVTP